MKIKDIREFWKSVEKEFTCSICGKKEISRFLLPLWWVEVGEKILCLDCYLKKKGG